MYINRHNKITKQFGFSLWELSIVMLIMIGLFIALVNVMPYIVKRENVEVDKSILVKMDEQLLGFIATYSRLPCPDNNNDGEEDRPNIPGATCTSSSGAVPYKTLGLNEDYAGIGSIPVQYAVFRNTGTMADLANNALDLFNPTDSHGTVTTLGNTNGLDFCTAITNAKASTFDSTYAHIILPDGTMRAVPYVLVTAGLANLDGGASAFDGENANGTLGFESANKEHTAIYDDSVFTKSFDELASSINCDTAQNSLDLLADGKATHEENLAQADNLKANAELAAFILGAQILLGIANTAMAAFTLVAAVATLATASSLLAGAIASCIVLVGCALIPVYTSGVVASVVAIVAGGVSVAANVAALITQAVAIGLIIDVANRAGAAISLPEDSSDDSATPVTNEQLAIDIRAQAEKLKADAAQKVLDARNTIYNARQKSLDIYYTLDDINSRASTLYATRDDFVNPPFTMAPYTTAPANQDSTFTTHVNNTRIEASNNRSRALNAYFNINNARPDADAARDALGTAVFVFPNITYPDIDYAVAVAELNNADTKMTNAAAQFTLLKDNYLNIRAHAVSARTRINNLRNADPQPPLTFPTPTQAEIDAYNEWSSRRDILNNAYNRAQSVITKFDEPRVVFYTEILSRRNDAQDALNEVVLIIADLAPLLPDATAQEIADRAAIEAQLISSRDEQIALIAYYNQVLNGQPVGFFSFEINELQDDIIIAFNRIEGAQASTQDAYESIAAAIEAEENAAYFEDNVGSGLPNPNGVLLEQAAGVDAILNAADDKGAER